MDTLYINNVLFPGRLCFETSSRGQDRLKVKRHTVSVSTYNKGRVVRQKPIRSSSDVTLTYQTVFFGMQRLLNKLTSNLLLLWQSWQIYGQVSLKPVGRTKCDIFSVYLRLNDLRSRRNKVPRSVHVNICTRKSLNVFQWTGWSYGLLFWVGRNPPVRLNCT